jgi:xanthine phosphoribosyltransferase
MKQTLLNWRHIECFTQDILRQMQQDQWQPDYVVGLTRGGLTPAVLISQYLGIPMYALKISLRDGNDDSESNLWMSEEAFGYVCEREQETLGSRWDPSHRKKILVVDDINDSGATLKWLIQDWQSSCLPNEVDVWNTVWNRNVKFAVLVDNTTSEFRGVDYQAMTVNKLDDPQWVVFPWEDFWQR